MTTSDLQIGEHLRKWRQRRRMSQLSLALDAEISTRHLSFLETGRSAPSREMVQKLSEQMGIPLRERNVLLIAAGFAPVFPERSLNDPQLKQAREAIEIVMNGQKPYPAFALDRHWNMVASNGALPQIYNGVLPELLAPPVNVMRLSLHPQGLARHIVNLSEWGSHLKLRLSQQIDVTADSVLIELLKELDGYEKFHRSKSNSSNDAQTEDAMIPIRLKLGDDVLSFFSTTMIFGIPLDITLSELALESFFPSDIATTSIVQRLEKQRIREV